MSDQKKGSGTKKYGRNKEKCAAYKKQQRREKNKLGRVLRSSGRAAAEHYAKLHNLAGYMTKKFGQMEARHESTRR